MPLQPGQLLAHYRIERQIGQGGMGVVYLAEDTRLGRRIALKVLPAEMSADAGRRARFEREARTIAALNHPNIVTLHSVEEVDGVHFLTMELVEGQSLTQQLTREGLPLPKLLEWSLGISDALVAAHRQGVVHRDLKPDNIMLTADGRIKVLDFGLAKLRESGLHADSTALPTSSITEEGKIVGTVAYMSPEQAEGKPLDHRSDIFSFGVLLYELAAGRRPFQGDTPISTLSSILKDTPPLLHQVNAALPQQLGRIVRRCLAKEPERRYQSTDDLRNELRELKEESDSGELAIERAASAPSTSQPSGISAPALPASSPAAGRTRLLLAAAVVVALAAVGGWLWSRRAPSGPSAPAAMAPIQMSRATTDGKVSEAAISPDGRYVAYVRREGAAFSLRLRQVVTGDEVQVVAPSETALSSPSFSSDGDFLHYVATPSGEANGSVYKVSVLGGAPRRLVDEAGSVSASPDGRFLALTGGTVDHSRLWIAGADGEGPRELTGRKGRDHFDSGAAWSPDGGSLAIVSHRFGEPQQIVLVDPATGVETLLPTPSLKNFLDLSWLPGGRSLIVAGSDRPVNQRAPAQVFLIPPGGEPQPLTRDLNDYTEVAVTADGSTIAALQLERRSGIEVAAVADGVPGAFTEIFPATPALAGYGGIAWLPGNRLVHGMLQAGVQQLFVTDVVSKSSRALTTGPSHQGVATSRDGRSMVAVRDEGDHSSLYRIDPETGRAQRLTEGQFDIYPVITSDGSWVVYSSALETIKLLKVPGSGGAPVELTQSPAWCIDIAPDNQGALCIVSGLSENPIPAIVPLAGGTPRPVTALARLSRTARFHPDGRTITYLDSHDGVDELWSVPVAGGEPRRLARFEGKEIGDFAWSPDGRYIVIVRTSRSGDVVLLKRTPA